MADEKMTQIIELFLPLIQGRTVAIWGINEKTEAIQERLSQENISSILLSTNFEKWMASGRKVYSPKVLNEKAEEYFVFVNTGKYHSEMEAELLEMGYKETDYVLRTHATIRVSKTGAEYYKDRYGNEIIGKIPINCEIIFTSWLAKVVLGNKIVFESKNIMRLAGNSNLTIGNDVFLGDGTSITVREGGTVILGNNCLIRRFSSLVSYARSRLEIGDGFRANPNLWISAISNGVRIGKNCHFSRNISVLSNDAHPLYDMDSKEVINLNFKFASAVTISDHVWVGVNASIFGDSEIGPYSVVGAHSVVKNAKIPAHCAVAGTPARIVRKNITWSPRLIPKELRESSEYFQ